MDRAGFVAVPGWNGGSAYAERLRRDRFFDSLVSDFKKRHTRRVKSEMSKSAKIELCVTKLRLSGLGCWFL